MQNTRPDEHGSERGVIPELTRAKRKRTLLSDARGCGGWGGGGGGGGWVIKQTPMGMASIFQSDQTKNKGKKRTRS